MYLRRDGRKGGIPSRVGKPDMGVYPPEGMPHIEDGCRFRVVLDSGDVQQEGCPTGKMPSMADDSKEDSFHVMMSSADGPARWCQAWIGLESV